VISTAAEPPFPLGRPARANEARGRCEQDAHGRTVGGDPRKVAYARVLVRLAERRVRGGINARCPIRPHQS
jgi:hypothetical protein